MDNKTPTTGYGSQSTSNDGRVTYNTPAIQVGNQVRDGDEFILITRGHQGEGFRVWSSGDQSVTSQLYSQAKSTLAETANNVI